MFRFISGFIIFAFCVVAFPSILTAQEELEAPVYQYLNQGKLKEAETKALKLIDAHPDYAGLHHVYGRVLFQQKKYKESIARIEKSMEIANQPRWMIAWSHFYLGLNHRELNNIEQAVEHFKTAVQMNATQNCTNAATNALKQMERGLSDDELERMTGWQYSLKGKPAPDFTLTDIYGQSHSKKEILGLPIVMHFGATWCGGCQMEADWLNKLEEKFRGRGTVFFKIHPGENIAAALDYHKHYRSNSISLVDYDYSVSNAYNSFSWPSTVIIGQDGIIAYHNIGASQETNRVEQVMDTLLKDFVVQSKEDIVETVCKDGVCYLPPQVNSKITGSNPIEPNSEFRPRGAFDSQGRLWVALSSNSSGDHNIELRCYENGAVTSKSIATRTITDDDSADVAIAPDDTVWVSWISDRDERYDVYCRSFIDGKWGKTMRVTESEDDAFRPRIAVDQKNRLWITYYKWNRQFRTSRDRDLFIRYFDGESWSKEIEVSPAEPKVEDHTDPAIAITSEGKIYAAWSYDYHPQLFDSPLDTDQPSIFVQQVNASGKTGDLTLVGTKGIRHHAVDLFPALTTAPNGDLWCAWDARLNNTRVILAKNLNNGVEERISSGTDLASTPSIASDSQGTVYVAWSQKSGDHWSVFGCNNNDGSWSEPTEWVQTDADYRNIQLLVDQDNKHWLIYESQSGKSVKVMVEKLN